MINAVLLSFFFFLHWLYQFMLREGFTYNNKNSNYNICHSLSNYVCIVQSALHGLSHLILQTNL